MWLSNEKKSEQINKMLIFKSIDDLEYQISKCGSIGVKDVEREVI